MVRRQVAASLGMLPQASRVRPLVSMLEKYGADPITVDAATSGLAGLENEVLGLLLQERRPRRRRKGGHHAPTRSSGRRCHRDALRNDCARPGRARQRSLWIAADTNRPMWQRVAVLRDRDGADGGGGGRARAVGRWRRASGRGAAGPAGLTLQEPAALLALANGTDELAGAAKSVASRVTWPGSRRRRRAVVAPSRPSSRSVLHRVKSSTTTCASHVINRTGRPREDRPDPRQLPLCHRGGCRRLDTHRPVGQRGIGRTHARRSVRASPTNRSRAC